LTLRTLDFLELENEISITEVPLPSSLAEKTIREIDFRTRFHLNIIAITREEHTFIEFDSSFTLQTDDELVVIGKNEDVSRFVNTKESV
ncbi:MAG: TrkA C-terminal domain-containing protein, partial [Sphaerochaetaceae bacterium]|nr:TrkA C-terminal domain-containing protein [Sphaerochaetaceae bacterium]